ncbi:MAG: hypothetical protein WCP09_00835 [Candidatus Taylorbacteria bacterium]
METNEVPMFHVNGSTNTLQKKNKRSNGIRSTIRKPTLHTSQSVFGNPHFASETISIWKGSKNSEHHNPSHE